MILYLTLIFLCMLLIAGIATLITGETFFALLGVTATHTALVIAVNGLTATFARLSPKRFADYQKRAFIVTAEEKRAYEKLRIRAWKDRIPEIGHFTGFRKNRLRAPKDPAYIKRFLMEICYGEIGHFYSCFTSFLIVFTAFIKRSWLCVNIPVAFVSAVLNVPPIMVLRYNSYKLRILLKKMEKA